MRKETETELEMELDEDVEAGAEAEAEAVEISVPAALCPVRIDQYLATLKEPEISRSYAAKLLKEERRILPRAMRTSDGTHPPLPAHRMGGCRRRGLMSPPFPIFQGKRFSI